MVFIALKEQESAQIAFMLENGVVGTLENRRAHPHPERCTCACVRLSQARPETAARGFEQRFGSNTAHRCSGA
ncbi:MAG: hypothetical protein ABR508_08860 [Candidatus Baltobacteraceae bacterium]